MAQNVPGAHFVSKGIEYVLKIGPKGNLRPYTIGPVVRTAKRASRIPVVGLLAGGAILVGGIIYLACKQEAG